MQPHVNAGINFRKHFKPFGFSKKRSLDELKKKIAVYKADIEKGILKPEYAKERLDDLKSQIREIKRGR